MLPVIVCAWQAWLLLFAITNSSILFYIPMVQKIFRDWLSRMNIRKHHLVLIALSILTHLLIFDTSLIYLFRKIASCFAVLIFAIRKKKIGWHFFERHTVVHWFKTGLMLPKMLSFSNFYFLCHEVFS